MTGWIIRGLLGAAVCAGPALAQTPQQLAAQWAQYEEVRAKTIVELQPFRLEQNARDPAADLPLRLITLNPAVGAWYLLQVWANPNGKPDNFHIENPDPARQQVTFDDGARPALIIRRDGKELRCRPWVGELTVAGQSALPYAPICSGRLFLRNKVPGNRTNLEAASEFLRDNVWGGESIVRFFKNTFFADSELENSEDVAADAADTGANGPAPMLIDAALAERPVISTQLDLGLQDGDAGKMAVGAWYSVAGARGVFASAFQPRRISKEVLEGPGRTNWLDSVERNATGYMVGFDMTQFDIGWAKGTDHPALGWSPRPAWNVRPKGLPGPDGVNTPAPLVPLGMVNPVIASRAVATFTAGFKRQHGAFKYGDMATFNLGHHYGFIEKGVILSKLQPNLSTFYGLTDGTIAMKTWTEADNVLLPRITFARQNGVPLLETDPETGAGIPGDRVIQWGGGNWSGSAEAKLRTLRAGVCMASKGGKSFLIYGYFSTATPSAMARTFQAYGCNYAMLLDMNALEHTYLAVYQRQAGKVHVGHIVPGMALIEKKLRGGTIIPRFIGFADNRDLFYLTRKEAVK